MEFTDIKITPELIEELRKAGDNDTASRYESFLNYWPGREYVILTTAYGEVPLTPYTPE